MATEVRLPLLGPTMTEGKIVSWRKQVGDAVEIGDVLVDVETEKLTTEVESEVAGTILSIRAIENSSVPVNGLLCVIGTADEGIADTGRVEKSATRPVHVAQTPRISKRTASNRSQAYISPLARRIADEHNFDYSGVIGTGPQGRITSHDITTAIEKSVAEAESEVENEPDTKAESANEAVLADTTKSTAEVLYDNGATANIMADVIDRDLEPELDFEPTMLQQPAMQPAFFQEPPSEPGFLSKFDIEPESKEVEEPRGKPEPEPKELDAPETPVFSGARTGNYSIPMPDFGGRSAPIEPVHTIELDNLTNEAEVKPDVETISVDEAATLTDNTLENAAEESVPEEGACEEKMPDENLSETGNDRDIDAEAAADIEAETESADEAAHINAEAETEDDDEQEHDGASKIEPAGAHNASGSSGDKMPFHVFDDTTIKPMRAQQHGHAMTGIITRRTRKVITEQMQTSTQTVKTNVTELLKFCDQINKGREICFSINDLVLKAVAKALTYHRDILVSLDGQDIVHYANVNIAFSVLLDDCVVMPVIRDVDRLSLEALSATTRELATRARANILPQEDYEDSSFSISNLGIFGVESYQPVINMPNAAILGICSVEDELALGEDNQPIVNKIMRLSITIDHRLIDGVVAARFQLAVKTLLENPLDIIL